MFGNVLGVWLEIMSNNLITRRIKIVVELSFWITLHGNDNICPSGVILNGYG